MRGESVIEGESNLMIRKESCGGKVQQEVEVLIG